MVRGTLEARPNSGKGELAEVFLLYGMLRSMVSFGFSLLLLVAVPLAAGADSNALKNIEKDRTFLENVLQYLTDDEAFFSDDLKQESEDELFPDSGSEVLLRRPLDQEPAVTEAFVTVPIGGKVLTLTDVPGTAWFAAYVRDAALKGIVSGYKDAAGNPTGEFGPGNSVTIEELAKIALNSAGIDIDLCGTTLKNPLAVDRWSAPFIRCAESRGFVIYSDGGIDPLRPATRTEVVVTMLQAFELTFGSVEGEERVFRDVQGSTQFASAIERAAKDGIVSGTTDDAGNPTGYFLPDDPVNRAEIAKIISLVLQVYGS